MRIAFLLHNAYAVGGTTRTTLNLAAALAPRHEVELVSVFRHRAEPWFAVDPALRLRALVDRRDGSADRAHPEYGLLGGRFPRGDSRAPQYHRLAERRIVEWLGATDADAVVTTRTGLNVLLAGFGPARALRIGQEHLTHDSHPHALRRTLQRHYGALHALVTTTEADARAHRTGLRVPGLRILAIPNGVPDPGGPYADAGATTIVAAGRLTRVKRFPMLVDAFARVAGDFPGWTLRIYGDGPERRAVADRIDRHGLRGRAELAGLVTPLEREWARGSVAAVTSARESFGMTIVEAMRCGLPVVSTDCPLGPREILRHGIDGLLVPRDDVDAFARSLRLLMADRGLRARMGEAARTHASRRFDPAVIAGRYDALLASLSPPAPAAPATSPTPPAPAAPAGGGRPRFGAVPVAVATVRIRGQAVGRRVAGWGRR
ncbi:glycosyltransferase family 4 protein [Streptomyces sp. NPDC006610]|uniref:glycosyltransferase family 4 protein n=1 Tax=Streptomyces sp. NPDC006610 TaxID=3154584 RepID=UPI0033AF8432